VGCEVLKLSVLVVEDTASLAEVYAQYLMRAGYRVTVVGSLAAARRCLADALVDAVLLDVRLPDGSGIDLIPETRDRTPNAAILVSTAHGSLTAAVDAMKAGADDYLVKPFNADRLLTTLRNALEKRRLSRIISVLGADLPGDRFEGFIGSSLGMRAVYRLIEQAAPSRATVFITGESGTGKEVCAEAIHSRGPRRANPFVAVNCSAIPRDLMESEIFGHVRGAFTGASTDREGAALSADRGILFLDELCEMELALQAKLLRFVQTGTVQKVGSDAVRKVDVRIVCATNRDPRREVEAGRLREDLFYRLHVIPIHLPPLRLRDDDAVEIARDAVKTISAEEGRRFQGLTPEAEALIRGYEWPGNIRQLHNVLRQSIVLNDGDRLTRAMLVAVIGEPGATATLGQGALDGGGQGRLEPGWGSPGQPASRTPPGEIKPLWMVERDAIEAAIVSCGGNVPVAAARLGVNPSTIYRKRLSWAAAKV